jgi:MiaB/RimO family radical SAM methylthiotransferase
LGNCTYCATKFARGELKSYSQDKIIEEIEKLLTKGVKEIQLTSQDLAVYGREKDEFLLVDLLKKIIAIDGNFRVKLGMMNIRFLKELLNDFLPLFKSPKIYNFLHLPLQSGSNKVLRDMNRGYKRDDFLNIVDEIRSSYDDFIFATDVIVGFPTESDKLFKMSYNLLKEYNLDIVNITRYSERKNTSAEKMKDMPSKIKKRRSRKLSKLTKKQRIKNNKKTVGNIYRGLIVRTGKNNTKLARLDNGKAVVLQEGKIGSFNKIKITDYKHNYLIGKIL